MSARGAGATAPVRVLLFGALRDQLGGERELPAAAGDVAALWELLTRDRPHLRAHSGVRAARNLTYCSWDEPVEPGDEIAFMPPVCGG